VAALIDALGWTEFELVGHSSGAAIAVEYTLAHPAQVRTLALIDPAPIEGVFTPLEGYVLLERLRHEPDLLRQALASLMSTLDVDAPDLRPFFDQLVTDAQQMAPAAFTATADALGRWNRFAEGRALTLPTLVVWGDQDPIVDRDAVTRTLIAIPGANRLDVMRGVGHSPMLEAPVALAELLIEFITEDYDEFDAIRHSGMTSAPPAP
jgi:branched-chain amino acid transport system permease protein